MTTQEFVKKEQISRKLNSIRLCLQAHPDNQPGSEFEDRIYDIEYIEQKLSAERERAGKLVEAVQSFVQASDDFNIGYINRNGEITRCGIAALSVAFNAAEKRLRIALTESNKP